MEARLHLRAVAGAPRVKENTKAFDLFPAANPGARSLIAGPGGGGGCSTLRRRKKRRWHPIRCP